MADRKDPYRNSRFKLEIQGIVQAGFSECTIPDATTDAVDYREGTDRPTLRKLSGLATRVAPLRRSPFAIPRAA